MLRDYFLKERNPVNFGPIVYAWLWRIALLGVLVSYLYSFRTSEAKFGNVIAFFLALAMTTQQWMVYDDIHDIEARPTKAKKEYPGWLDLRLEHCFRVGIILALLFGVGKIASAFTPLAEHIPHESIKHAIINFLQPPDTESHFSHSLLVMGSTIVFGLLILWNIFALSYRLKKWPNTKTVNEKAHEIVITIRIVSFIILSVTCFVFWVSVFVQIPWVGDVAKFILVSYIILVLVVLLLRWDPTCERIEKGCAKVLGS